MSVYELVMSVCGWVMSVDDECESWVCVGVRHECRCGNKMQLCGEQRWASDVFLVFHLFFEARSLIDPKVTNLARLSVGILLSPPSQCWDCCCVSFFCGCWKLNLSSSAWTAALLLNERASPLPLWLRKILYLTDDMITRLVFFDVSIFNSISVLMSTFRSWFLYPRQGFLTKVPILLFTHLYSPQSEALRLYKQFWLNCTHSNSNQPLSCSTQELLQLSSQENAPARVCLSKDCHSGSTLARSFKHAHLL